MSNFLNDIKLKFEGTVFEIFVNFQLKFVFKLWILNMQKHKILLFLFSIWSLDIPWQTAIPIEGARWNMIMFASIARLT